MSETIVTLDLRGTRFTTLQSTFDKLDLSAIAHVKINENEYFIDRDPKYFHLILNFASTGKSLSEDGKNLPFTGAERKYFLNETKMYGLCHCVITEYHIAYKENCKKHKDH